MSYVKLAARLEAGSKSPLFDSISNQTKILTDVQCATIALICERAQSFNSQQLTTFIQRLEHMQLLMPDGGHINSAQIMVMVAAEVGL